MRYGSAHTQPSMSKYNNNTNTLNLHSHRHKNPKLAQIYQIYIPSTTWVSKISFSYEKEISYAKQGCIYLITNKVKKNSVKY